MIIEVGAWAMQQAVSQYAAWQAAGIEPPPIAVNVSAVQLKRKDFVISVQQAIAIAGKLEHGLDLEITESMIMEDIESSIEKLKLIRALGVGSGGIRKADRVPPDCHLPQQTRSQDIVPAGGADRGCLPTSGSGC